MRKALAAEVLLGLEKASFMASIFDDSFISFSCRLRNGLSGLVMYPGIN